MFGGYPAYSIEQRRAGVVAPTITGAPVVTWTVEIGSSPAIAPPTYSGSPGTITYTLLRDGTPVAGVEDVDEATLEAYAAVAADMGPSLTVEAVVSNGGGTDSDTSNAVEYYPDTHFRDVWDLAAGVTTADAGATVDSIADQGSGSVTITAPLSGSRPTFNASDAGFGGEPSMTLDGSADELNGTLGLGVALTAASLFAVMRIGAAGAANQVWAALRNSTAGPRLRQVGADATAKTRFTTATAATNSDAVANIGEGVEFLAGGTWNGGTPTQSVFQNSSTADDTDTPALTTTANPQTVDVGAFASANYANISLALLVANPTVVSATAIASLVAYVFYRFGVP